MRIHPTAALGLVVGLARCSSGLHTWDAATAPGFVDPCHLGRWDVYGHATDEALTVLTYIPVQFIGHGSAATVMPVTGPYLISVDPSLRFLPPM